VRDKNSFSILFFGIRPLQVLKKKLQKADAQQLDGLYVILWHSSVEGNLKASHLGSRS
jgi:hypothetical protein